MTESYVPYPIANLLFPIMTEKQQQAMFITYRAVNAAHYSMSRIKTSCGYFTSISTENLSVEVSERDCEAEVVIWRSSDRALVFVDDIIDGLWRIGRSRFLRGDWEVEFAEQTAECADPGRMAEAKENMLWGLIYGGKHPYCRIKDRGKGWMASWPPRPMPANEGGCRV